MSLTSLNTSLVAILCIVAFREAKRKLPKQLVCKDPLNFFSESNGTPGSDLRVRGLVVPWTRGPGARGPEHWYPSLRFPGLFWAYIRQFPLFLSEQEAYSTFHVSRVFNETSS